MDILCASLLSLTERLPPAVVAGAESEATPTHLVAMMSSVPRPLSQTSEALIREFSDSSQSCHRLPVKPKSKSVTKEKVTYFTLIWNLSMAFAGKAYATREIEEENANSAFKTM